MEIKNCKGCGRLFNYLGGPPLCPACVANLEKKFVEVKAYIRENPAATMQQISDDNDVSTKQLKQWGREERLRFTDDSPIGMECEKCGAMIKTGSIKANDLLIEGARDLGTTSGGYKTEVYEALAKNQLNYIENSKRMTQEE